MRAAAALVFAVALRMRAAGRGGSEDEVEGVDEAEDEEEVVDAGLILRVLDAFRPRGATWSGQVISSPPGPSGGPSKTHLLPGGGVPRVHRARSPVLPRRPRFATPRSVHQLAAVAAGTYPLRRPPNAWSPGAPAPPAPCYWLVASGTPLGWRGGCLA